MLTKKYFGHYIRKYPGYFWKGIGSLAVTNVLDVVPPLIIMKGIDQITNKAPISELRNTALLLIFVTTVLAIVRYFWRAWFGYFHQNVALDLRNRTFEKLTQLGPSFYGKNPTGELMSLATNDVESIRMGIGPGLIILVDAVLYFVTIPPIMLSLSVPLTFKCLVLLPFLPFFINWLGNVIHRLFEDVQEKFSELSAMAQENISGIRVIKSFVQEENQTRFFDQKSLQWHNASLKAAWAETFMHPVMEFCVTAGTVVLLYLGSKDVINGSLSIGGFVAFQRYIAKMVWPMTAFGWGYSLVSQASASIKRLDKLLQTPPDIIPPMSLNSPPDFDPDHSLSIEFRNLSFTYPQSQSPALKNISLTINGGEIIGIVGPVGSGKTTLAQLLCRLYEFSEGQILINGVDIKKISLNDLRRHISLVPQDPFLFSTSISENIAFGLDQLPPKDSLVSIAKVAKMDVEINELPDKFGTLLGERGINLSGGQKQRLTIARALLRKSPVVVFDDSLSAVDSETEKLILERLDGEIGSRTTLIISHRLSSLAFCDRILVLNNGTLESIGSHEELEKSSKTYRELMELQGYG